MIQPKTNKQFSKHKEKRKTLYIKEKAELKIRLTMAFGGTFETSWFGIVQEYKGNYLLKNILIPPQENEPAFVTTKDDEYLPWFFKNVTQKNLGTQLRLHGHTHPTFAPIPSGTDVKQFKNLLEEVDNYFIQLILNNDMEYTCLLHIKGKKDPVPLEVVFEYGKKMNKILSKMIHKNYMPRNQISMWEYFEKEKKENGSK